MGKIVILDEITANKIAAGEVVERPSSVVKEMIENSIDAGATNITVEIKNGGIAQIKIIDNGHGIASDDVEIAFERHSTSKIRSAGDLDNISTLGFRGEALASISSVSKVELVSREESMPMGRYVRVEGGRVVESRPIGCPIGTTFIVNDLFYNTPARYKFLKKDTTEGGYVADIVSRIALARPDISFKFINKGKIVIHTPGNSDLKSTIFSIYGKDVSNGIVEVDFEDNNIKVSGFVGKPEIARGTRNQQSIYLNKRYIKSKLVGAAVEEAYKTFLMKGKYPFLVLNLEVNSMTVDVNVHPAKMEVRFSNEKDIFRAIHHAISNALLDKTEYRKGSFEKNIFKNENISSSEYVQNNLVKESFSNNPGKSKVISDKNEIFIEELIKKNLRQNKWVAEVKDDIKHEKNDKAKIKEEVNFQSINIESDANHNKEDNMRNVTFDEIEKKRQNNIVYETSNINREDCIKQEKVEDTRQEINFKEEVIHTKKESFENKINNLLIDCIVLGQLFCTYILIQKDNEFYIIDQHAAHERIMFEKLKEKYDNKQNMSQELLVPIIIEMTQNEIRTAVEYQDELNKLGFIFEMFGNNTLIIRGVPAFSEEDNIKQYFIQIIDRIISKNDLGQEEYINETLYNIACKAAIKANNRLDEKEIHELLKELNSLENPFTCPHGRPTAVKITKYEIEKMFKRIV